MVLQLHPGEALKPKKEAERGETPTHNVKVYRRLDEGQRELVDNMRSCATSAILSLSILALFLLDCQQCARTSSRDRTPASAPARSSAGSRSSSSSSSSADSDLLTDECPEPNGYFADGYQCDKYYECIEGVINEKLCPDGMVFNDYSIQYEKCDLPFNIDCSSRPQLQEPKPSLNCPRLNGYFAHENVTVCDKFYYCVDGKYNMITCPSGLVYNEKTGICTWPDEAKKKHCSSEEGEELNGREKEREKRVSIWPAEDEEDVDGHQEVSGSYEDQDGRLDDEVHDGASGESFGEDYDDSLDFTSNEEQFPYDSEFENFDADFANFGLSDESVSSESDHYDDIHKKRRRNDEYDDGDDVDQLDDYIREYVKQANKGGGDKAAGMDLSYYEKIAEEAVKKEAEKKKMAEESSTAKNRKENREAANKGANLTNFNRTAFGLRDLLLAHKCKGVS